MPTLAAWLHDLDPFAVRLGPGLGLRWYGLAYIAGFAAAWAILRALARRGLILLTPERAGDAIFALAVGTVVGGRMGYVLIYEPSLLWTFTAAPPWWGLLAINRGGMASHGGMVGAILACAWLARAWRIPTLHFMDIFALCAPVGLLLGRLANFVNGELLGRVASMPGQPAPWWSVKFPSELIEGHAPPLTPEQTAQLAALLHRVAPGEPYETAARLVIRDIQNGAANVANDLAPLLSARHPSQLYQAFAEGVVLGLALLWIWRKPRRVGVVSAWFLMLYGVGRIITEFWRLPDAHLAAAPLGQRPGGLSYGQWLSAVMVVAGLGLLLWATRRGGRAERIGGWLRPAPSPART